MQIYLDHGATTPPCPEAIASMTAVMSEQWGNPSSIHSWGERAATIIEQARMQVASLLNAPADSIIFTSGGTESDNLALAGLAAPHDRPQHLILSSVEHSAVSEPAAWLERQGWQVTRLPVDRAGRVNVMDLQSALRPDTAIVSMIYGQSEVGTLQPIHEMGQLIQDWRQHHDSQLVFHTDAVQVAGRLPIDVQQLPVDLLSISSHKLYGPQGAGALYVRPGVTLAPLLRGGGQEFRLRSGTQAVPTIAGFGMAAEMATAALETEYGRLQHLRDRLFAHLADHPLLLPTGHRIHRLPHHVSFCLHPKAIANSDQSTGQITGQITGKHIVRQMNLAGIAISSGSACNSGKTIASPTLRAMGFADAVAKTGIRFTLGHSTTAADIDWTAVVLRQVLARLQPTLPLVHC